MSTSEAQRNQWAAITLAGVRREFPNKIAYVLTEEGDARLPRAQTPIFFGSFDWHSAVHTHWSMVQLCMAGVSPAQEAAIRADLTQWINPERARVEANWLRRHPSFENPYGLVWLLHLTQSLRTSDTAWMIPLAEILQPVEDSALANLEQGFAKLPHAIRHGLHAQTAFALGMTLDWAVTEGRQNLRDELACLARRFFSACRNHTAQYEPSGYDFLSPVLAEADVMSRILSSGEFAKWWIDPTQVLEMRPLDVADPSHGHAVHYAGLNLSRAWMLLRIADKLPLPEANELKVLARNHATQGLAQIDPDQFAGSHWLVTFALYYELVSSQLC